MNHLETPVDVVTTVLQCGQIFPCMQVLADGQRFRSVLLFFIGVIVILG
jgi:hypothetical protein